MSPVLAPGPVSPALLADIAAAARPRLVGRVERLLESQADVVGLPVGVGDLVMIGATEPVLAEVVAAAGSRVPVRPYGALRGRRVGEPVWSAGRQMLVATGRQLLGRVLDGLGRPLDGGPPLDPGTAVSIHHTPPAALERPRITQPLQVGVRVLDTLLTSGRGQRVAILAGSGVGKSSLLSMLVRGTEAECSVLCLVGERGREVREFIENDLGPEGLARSVVVVATSDQPALVRRNAAYLATRVAEGFRDEGMDVNLLMDSVTRFAIAQREIGLAAGEVPTTRGYPPSALGLLPGLLERAGTSASGSITGFYTVLVEGDDLNDPVGDTVRSITDGHISLSRDLANAGHFPSIDVLRSASRVVSSVCTPEQRALAAHARRLLATYDRARDLIEIGAYAPGADAEIDRAVALHTQLEDFTRQPLHELTSAGEAWQMLAAVLGDGGPGDAGAGSGGAGGAR